MSRAVSNLLIVLVMAATATAVLAFSSNTADIAEPGEGAPASAPQDDAAADETFGEQAADALKDAGDGNVSTETGAAATNTDAGAASNDAGSDDDADVLGAAQAQPAQVQESSSDVLAETGPIEVGQWIVMAAAVMAMGGLVRNAGRDHRDGLLTVLP